MSNKVSIIVPCYNQAEYLPETLNSVLAQTYTNWECIIVDDGSVDKSHDVAKEYVGKDCRFTYLYQDNQGPSAARNNGIMHASGDYILPLDADDLIADSYIEKAVSVFETNPEYKVVYCRAKKFGVWDLEWRLPEYSYDKILWDNVIFVTAMYRRVDYNNTSGYNSNMRGGLEDWDFWLSLLEPSDKVYRIDEILFYYRIKTTSRTTQVRHVEQELLHTIYQNHKEKYEPYIRDLIDLKRQNERLKGQCLNLKKHEQDILKSWEYRLGEMLLKPVRIIWDAIRN